MAVSVRQYERTRLNITNVYIPPSVKPAKFSETALDKLIISSTYGTRSIIAGDFNAHNKLWDMNSKEDKKGLNLIDWINRKELCVKNDKDVPTRKGYRNQQNTSPDVTMVTKEIEKYTIWSVDETLESDHFPIIIRVKPPRTSSTVTIQS